ncbi:conserved Plasmodium protein, unknown function [Plasmodium ovale curtisi]|uniref:BRO1 domain-containing protein n=2 Tax=Plasmodium ovale curtisi TaxID=864141 RepID=A0A1A8W6W8_PLAOA|nr:conserved Plasmodium protein, unknown function [Plasmodium ovale curtisi]
MQVVSDFANIKYLYDKVNIGKIVYRNLRERSNGNSELSFEEEISSFTNLRNAIMTEQYKGLNRNLLNLYKEYLFYFETFRMKKLLSDKKKILYTNDFYEKGKKVEYEFEQENILIIYNIGIIKSNMVKLKKNTDDIKLLNKLSNDVIDIFNYLFQHLNEEKLPEMIDINSISCYIFLSMSMAYHENMFYNTAILKKYKRNLLAKLSYNIYTHFHNILQCLDGKMIDVFKSASNFSVAKGNLQHLRSNTGSFYNFVYVNKIIFISISNYHTALKYAQVCPDREEVIIQKYEEDKIGEIISRLKYSLECANKGIEICKKYNLSINFTILKEKIITSLNFFEYENKNIYFEVIPYYENLTPLKGTAIIKAKNIDIDNIYIKRNISNNLKLLFNENAKHIYDIYNEKILTVHNFFIKNFLSLNEQYKLINLSYRKNILVTLNNVIINTYNRMKQLYNPTVFDSNLNFLVNVEISLRDILVQVENNLTTEHNNHVEFQKKFMNVGINEESINSYKNFLFHLNNFKNTLNDLTRSIDDFKKFLERNYSNFQICEMDISSFFKYVIDELNGCTTVNIDSLDGEYTYYRELLSDGRSMHGEVRVGGLIDGDTTSGGEPKLENSVGDTLLHSEPVLNYANFQTFLKENNLNFAIQNNINNQNLFHYNTLNNYINVHSEEKLFFVIISIYFSLSIQLTQLKADLRDVKTGMNDNFLNAITEESDTDKLNDLLEKEKGLLNVKKVKLEESVSLFEKDLNKFYDYYHEYNKLDYYKTIDVSWERVTAAAYGKRDWRVDLNSFMNELMEVFEKLNAMHKKHSYTLKGSLMLKDDINRYIYMRESERSNIRVQHIPNSYPGNIHNSRERFY